MQLGKGVYGALQFVYLAAWNTWKCNKVTLEKGQFLANIDSANAMPQVQGCVASSSI